jgi:hypothetical protein
MLFGIPGIAWIVLLLLGIAISVWVAMSMLEARDWNFKEQSLKYLRDVQRKSVEFPVLSQPSDPELVEYKIVNVSSQDPPLVPRFPAEVLLNYSPTPAPKAETV